MSGLAHRETTSNLRATDEAVAEAGHGSLIFQPIIGKTFDSCQEAFTFYNLYSWEWVSFRIRYGRSRTNSQGYRTRQDIICSCSVSLLIVVTS